VTPEVSVLLPYRQAAETLDEALDSLLAQRGADLEIIAIDDGSSDGGPAIVARHPQITRLATGGTGLVAALTAGLPHARAPFVARMDADDVCHPDRLAHQLAALRADPSLGAVGTRVEAFPDDVVKDGMRRYVDWQNSLVTSFDHAREIFIESPLCHPSVVLRRSALDIVGPWRDGPWPEDYDLWLRLDAAGFGLAKVPHMLLRWRHRSGRATFSDPRYAPERFREAKAPHLARRLRSLGRPVAIWGAGPNGRRLARALEAHGVRAETFVDIDPRKIGHRARNAPIVAPDALRLGTHTVVAAVGSLGARELIRAQLDRLGFVEGTDSLFAA
jgi:glycosyltransferase involved in cell wall biosynthesis